MWRKRSNKSRYWRLLRQLRFIPGLAAVALTGCASQPVPSSSPPVALGETTTTVPPQPDVRQDVRELFDPRWWPIELMLTPELQARCRPTIELPSQLVLNNESEQADKLEPLVSCLAFGLTTGSRLHVAGETELPGALQAPGSGHANAFRATLAKLGVPLETIQVHRVDSGRSIEVGIEPSTS